jgi:hypothetical protein
MDDLIGSLCMLLRLRTLHARTAFDTRRRQGGDEGVSTLEMAIIALGLMAIAGLLVAALVSAVTSRTSKIN